MAPNIGQIIAVSYNAVLNDQRKPANQWADSSWLMEMESQGGVVKDSFGAQIEETLDYRRNPAGVIQATDLQPLSLAKTEVFDAAQYDIAEVVEPVTWSNKDEVQNPTVNQKIALVKNLLTNAIDSHDDLLEQTAFSAAVTNGFIPLPILISTAGTGTVGSIDSGTYAFWRNVTVTYTDDTDVEAALTSAWNSAAKGSRSKMKPSLIVSDGATNALFEGTQVGLQRYGGQDFKAAAKSLMFKTAPMVFSQYGTTTYFMYNTKSLRLRVSKEYFRQRSETIPLQNATGYTCRIYSACQMTTNNRSRVACVHL